MFKTLYPKPPTPRAPTDDVRDGEQPAALLQAQAVAHVVAEQDGEEAERRVQLPRPLQERHGKCSTCRALGRG